MFRSSFLAALGLVLLMTTSASAQFRGMRFPPSLQNIFMLRGEAVQKELGVNDEQKKTLSELAAQLQAEAMEIISGLQDLSPEEQKEHMPELMKMVGEQGQGHPGESRQGSG